MNSKIHNLSLQGITGVLVGVLFLVYILLINFLLNQFLSATGGISLLPISFFEILLIFISLLFIFISYIIIVLINRKRRRKLNLERWELNAKHIRRIYIIHLIFGGIISYIFMEQGLLKLIIPASLILYGVSSILVHKYTLGATKILGILFLINGILSILFPNLLFILWGLAFGGYHIIYGILHYKKVNSNF